MRRHRGYAEAGWEGHNDLCFLLLSRLLWRTEGELLTRQTHINTQRCEEKPWNAPKFPSLVKHICYLKFLECEKTRGEITATCCNSSPAFIRWKFELARSNSSAALMVLYKFSQILSAEQETEQEHDGNFWCFCLGSLDISCFPQNAPDFMGWT